MVPNFWRDVFSPLLLWRWWQQVLKWWHLSTWHATFQKIGIFTPNGTESPDFIYYLFFELWRCRWILLEAWKFLICCSSCHNLQFLRWQLVTIYQELLQEDMAIIQPQIRMEIKTASVLHCLQCMSYILHSHHSDGRYKIMGRCIPVHKHKVTC